MTLKEELEILRGEPIEVYEGDPLDIPCIETSDSERLCKHPVVSVHMLAYNHEPYIRQAIEGVMMQKTDFEFELVIGEDCSQDKTREICFEYQQKYPDKIRVLWWHENVSKLGGNGVRTTAHCRGEFVAFCEGDDYWIDPLKLQKQADVMRRYPSVTLVFTGAKTLNDESGVFRIWNKDKDGFIPGFITGKQLQLWTSFGKSPPKPRSGSMFVMTCTMMYRVVSRQKAMKMFDINRWRLATGDAVLLLSMAGLGDAYYLEDVTGVYRRTRTGASNTNTSNCAIDTRLARMYFANRVLGLKLTDVTAEFLDSFYEHLLWKSVQKSAGEQRKYIRNLLHCKSVRLTFTRLIAWPGLICLWLGIVNMFVSRVLVWAHKRVRYEWCAKAVIDEYTGKSK